MRVRITFFRAVSVLALLACASLVAPDLQAQGNCTTFGKARKAGWISGMKLRSAGTVKKSVEARTGGKVVSFLICRSGPTYKLTVMRSNGNVMTVTEPAQ